MYYVYTFFFATVHIHQNLWIQKVAVKIFECESLYNYILHVQYHFFSFLTKKKIIQYHFLIQTLYCNSFITSL